MEHLNRFPEEITKFLLEDVPGPTWLVEVRGELPGHHPGYARFIVSCLSCLLRPFSLGFGMSCPVERRGDNSEDHLSQDCPQLEQWTMSSNKIQSAHLV